MLVYVIRHGESENNRAKLWTGWLDVSLTEKGVEDAEKAHRYLQGISFDAVYASDLKRAKQTAEICLPDGKYQTTPLLREINVGTLAGCPLSFLTDEDRARIAKEGYVMFQGESQEAFDQRILSFKKELEALSCERVAAFSHAGFLRGMLDSVLGVRHIRGTVQCKNCAIAVFEYSDGKWSLHSWINL
jgi:broad specificity phosphatase PhoE